MTAPDFIWAEEIGTATKGGQAFRIGRWITDESASHPDEYVRRDPAVLATLPEVQALVMAERERCAGIADVYHQRALGWAKTVRGLAQHIGKTDSSRIAAAIRAGTEGGE